MRYLRDMRIEFDDGETVLALRGNSFIVRDPSGCMHLEREQILRFVSTADERHAGGAAGQRDRLLLVRVRLGGRRRMNYLIQFLRRLRNPPRNVWIVRQPGTRLYWCGSFYSEHFPAPKPMFAEDEATAFPTRQAALAQWQEHHPDADAVEARYAPNVWDELAGVRLTERLYFPETTYLIMEPADNE